MRNLTLDVLQYITLQHTVLQCAHTHTVLQLCCSMSSTVCCRVCCSTQCVLQHAVRVALRVAVYHALCVAVRVAVRVACEQGACTCRLCVAVCVALCIAACVAQCVLRVYTCCAVRVARNACCACTRGARSCRSSLDTCHVTNSYAFTQFICIHTIHMHSHNSYA